MKDGIRNLIANGKLNEALTEVKQISVSKKILNDLTVASFQLSEISTQSNLGLITNDELLRIKTKIAFLILGVLNEEENNYKAAFQKWINNQFQNAKEIIFDFKITPNIVIDCFVEDKDNYSFIFSWNKLHIKNLKETIKGVYQMIWAHEFYYVCVDDCEDAELSLLSFFHDPDYDAIMDLNEIEDISILKGNLNDAGEFTSDREFKEEKD